MMESKEIARRLVVGSAAIDRMRQDIHQTVTMLLGMVTEKEIKRWRKTPECQHFDLHDECRQYFKPAESAAYEEGCSWMLIQFSSRQDPQAICTLLDVVGNTAHYRNAYQSGAPYGLTLEFIQRVHMTLPLFVGGMIGAFPSLGDKLKLFLKAADYSKRNGW